MDIIPPNIRKYYKDEQKNRTPPNSPDERFIYIRLKKKKKPKQDFF